MYKALLVVLLFLFSLFLFGCTSDENPGLGDALDVEWWDTPCEAQSWQTISLYKFTTSDYYEHERAQNKVAEIPVAYPLDSDEKISQYAWAVYDILARYDLLDKEYLPEFAECFSDDTAVIFFMQPAPGYTEDGVYSIQFDRKGMVAVVSTAHGHIIHYGPST